MKSLDDLDTLEWARAVNTRWIVHDKLKNTAQEWMDCLGILDDGRLLPSCMIARKMCGKRDPLDDPKPWFYAGLFHLATTAEAEHFLKNHRVTRATVPALADDEAVKLWLDRISPETKLLLGRLKEALASIQETDAEA